MKYAIEVEIPNLHNINLELDDTLSPKTVKSFLKNLPFSVVLNLWGKEIYTDESPINIGKEMLNPQWNCLMWHFGPHVKQSVYFMDPPL